MHKYNLHTRPLLHTAASCVRTRVDTGERFESFLKKAPDC